jgi:predicted dehydrogenase
MYGEKGSLAFDLEDMNRLRFYDATEPPNLQAYRNILVTGPDHPYSVNFWKPGHLVGYEHTFIATLGDFLLNLAKGEPFHPNFDDAVRTQAVLEAVETSAASKNWIRV